MYGEAPWSSGERRRLRIWPIVLGRGFNSRLHLKTRWKDGPLDGTESNEKIKAAKGGKPHQKKLGKVTNIEYGNIDFEKFIIELLTSTRG